MAVGGARQGQPGKSYSNRTDLNIDRAPMPGSSAAPVPSVPISEQGPPPMLPDDIPTLDTETQFPDEPVTAGLPFGAGSNTAPIPASLNSTMIDAALRRNPTDPDLLRVAAYMRVRDL